MLMLYKDYSSLRTHTYLYVTSCMYMYAVYLDINVVVELVATGTCGVVGVSSSLLPHYHYGNDDGNYGNNQHQYEDDHHHHNGRRSPAP